MAFQLSDIKTRYAHLIGDVDSTNLTAVDTSHINAFIKDVCNAFPFSWAVASTSLTLSSGTANLPTTYNPRWGLKTAAITGTSQNDDHNFTQVPIEDRDAYSADDYVYWITYDNTNHVHVFNTHTQTGTVTIYYQLDPATLTADAEYCIVPDLEAVSYGAAAKYWIPDERNPQLATEYEKQANTRIQQMWQADNMFGAQPTMNTIIDLNNGLTDGSSSDLLGDI